MRFRTVYLCTPDFGVVYDWYRPKPTLGRTYHGQAFQKWRHGWMNGWMSPPGAGQRRWHLRVYGGGGRGGLLGGAGAGEQLRFLCRPHGAHSAVGPALRRAEHGPAGAGGAAVYPQHALCHAQASPRGINRIPLKSLKPQKPEA
eukprot:4506677-Pyramimonas_sp.AAC.1